LVRRRQRLGFDAFASVGSSAPSAIEVRDTLTGLEKTYQNPLGAFGSVGDTEGLPRDG
jgi:hypothetical protein